MGAKWFWGIVILTIAAFLLSWFGPWSVKAQSAAMGASVKQALTDNGMKFATAEIDGNVAVLKGVAPSKAAAEKAVSTAAAAGYPNADRPWHSVANEMTIRKTPKLRTQAPYTFSGVKSEDGNIVLSGFVMNNAARRDILNTSRAYVEGAVKNDKILLALGQPNAAWKDVVNASIAELNILDKGRFSLENNQVVINGVAADETVRNRINAFVTNLPIGYEGAANVSVPDAEVVNVGEIKSESICQVLINDLKGDNKINFGYDKAEIRGAPSFDLLNSLASAAKQCADFQIKVEGHTDADGDDSYNQSLSEARANTVVAYLADNGVELDRLTATGFGESRPLADNTTPAGMAQNRRIEFIVTQAE